MAVELPPAPAPNRVARELAAIVLVALAAFGVLSLVSAAAGQNPNLCGILGGAAAAAADGLFGFQAYVLAILVLALALQGMERRAGAHAGARESRRSGLAGSAQRRRGPFRG